MSSFVPVLQTPPVTQELRFGALEAALVAGAYIALLGSSGIVVTRTLATAAEYTEPSERERDIGSIVGKTENVLVLTFMLLGAYTALAIVFAAKSIVRREDMKNNSLFYLAGTLVNFTYSIVVGLLVRIALAAI